jgi:hypothetical protein
MESRELSPSITAVTSGKSHTPGPWHVAYSRSWNAAPIVALDGFGNDVRIATISQKRYYVANAPYSMTHIIGCVSLLIPPNKGGPHGGRSCGSASCALCRQFRGTWRER